MESLTYFKNLRITPRKYRAVLAEVKGLKPTQTVQKLGTMNKKAAMSLRKVVMSAIANGRQTLKVGEDMLKFKLFTVEEGTRLKRFRPGSRGMAKAFYRRAAHIKIILESDEMPVVASKAEEPKKAPVKEVAAEPKKSRSKVEKTK